MSCLSHWLLQPSTWLSWLHCLGIFLPTSGSTSRALLKATRHSPPGRTPARSSSLNEMPSRLHKLPAELLLLVLRHLNVLDLGALLCADYSLLHRHQIVQGMPVLRALTACDRMELQRLFSTRRPGLSCTQGFPLPLELWLQMDPLLSYDDRVSLASAMWPILALRWNVGSRNG